MSKYAIIFESKEVRSQQGNVLSQQNEKYIVVNEPDGWVDGTSMSLDWAKTTYNTCFPKTTKTFSSRENAEKFFKKWNPHPWYVQPNGVYSIVELKPITREIIIGYTSVE